MDWPNISKKAVDHPFGPFSDSFSEKQHKFGQTHKKQNRKNEEIILAIQFIVVIVHQLITYL
jgi:hypothetical protein